MGWCSSEEDPMIFTKENRVLVLAAHPDDEFGCGGLVSILCGKGAEVRYEAFTDCSVSLGEGFTRQDIENECRESLKILGVKESSIRFHHFPVRTLPTDRQPLLEILVDIKKEYAPTLVLCPSSYDIHQDHQQLNLETIRAFREASILGYEMPYNCRAFGASMFVELSNDVMKTKEEAVAKYRSQESRPHGTSSYARTTALYRGVQCRRKFAEAFEVIQMMLYV